MPAIAGFAIVLALFTGAAMAMLGAQQTPPAGRSQTQPVFRTGVDLVRIDVSVFDASGRPVHGLTAADFTLLEDGKPQAIEAVSEVNVPDADEGPAWVRDVAPDVRSNSAEDGRVLIFLLDDAMVPAADSKMMSATVRRVMGAVIDRLGPTDLAAVLFTWQNKRDSQDFTNDHHLLQAAVSKFVPKGPIFNGAKVSAGVTESVVKYLTDLPARRKALIFVTPSLPTRYVDRLADGGFPTGPETSVTDYHVWGAIDEALRAKVTVYGINPTGLQALGSGDSAALLSPDGTGGRPAPPLRAPPRSLAADTGGFMIGSPSQFNAGVTQLLRETGSYYLLGYRSTNPPARFHATDVQVRAGWVVKAHTGYLTTKPEKRLKEPAPALTVALAGVLPKADLPLRVTAAPFAVVGKSDADIAVVLGIQEPVGSLRAVDRVGMQVRAFTFHGDPRGMTEQHLDVFVPAGSTGEAYIELLARLRLKPGRYELRLSARSDRLERDGSAYLDLDVPDFTKAPVSLSGIVLSPARATGAVPADAFTSFVPVIPTTERTFRRIDRVSAFLRVYEGGKKPAMPVAMTVRILDDQDHATTDSTEALEAARFGTARAADFRIDLPLATLAPGRHLLRIGATLGATTAKREIRFTVR